MSEVIPRNEKYLVYFDNWFASLRLFGVLADLGIGALGTIRTDRFPDLTFSHDSEMKKIGRGCYEDVKTSVNGHEVRAIKWLDNRSVKLATTFDSAQPLDEVKRYDRTKKSEITIPIPHAVMTYNKFMGGCRSFRWACCLLSHPNKVNQVLPQDIFSFCWHGNSEWVVDVQKRLRVSRP